MRRILTSLLTLPLAACFTTFAHAAEPVSFSFPLARAPHAMPLNSSLSDPAWQAGKVPDRGSWENVTTRTPASHRTTVYALYDATSLYVAFDAEQDGTPVVAGQTTNDVGFGLDDFVGVGVDPSASGAKTYFFETTPRGVRYEQSSENARFRPQWRAAASAVGGHWRAVLIVPLNVMRLPAEKLQSWRVNFVRGVAAVGEHYSWAYDTLMQDAPSGAWPQSADVRFWPAARGIALDGPHARARPQSRIEAYALASAGMDRTQFQQADGTFQSQRVRPLGIDASVPLSDTINFVGTLAPDFSNVEIDQQSIAPQEFRRQLSEYRPFFAQGAAYINVPENAYTNLNTPPNQIFYSPDIGPFDRGEKIEGTYGKQSIGLLNFRGYDQVTGDTFDDTAFGFKHGLADKTFQYYVEGVSAHHSLSGNDETIEAGTKGRNNHTGFVWNFDEVLERGSWVPQGSAHSSFGFLDVHKPNQEVLLGYADISPNFNPIDGYTANSDIRGFEGFYNANGTAPWAKSVGFYMQGDRFLDRSGAVHEADSAASVNVTFKNQFSINGAGAAVGLLRGYDAVSGDCATGVAIGRSYFTGFPCYRNGRTDPFNVATIPIGYRDGSPAPVDVSANWGNFGPNNLHFYTFSTSRPLGRATVGVEYDGSYERDRTTAILQSQWLRRISLGFNTGPDSNVTIALRDINGPGGFAIAQGFNLSAAFHTRLRHGDLYLNYGTPAAPSTLDRFILKYVFREGAEAGT